MTPTLIFTIALAGLTLFLMGAVSAMVLTIQDDITRANERYRQAVEDIEEVLDR